MSPATPALEAPTVERVREALSAAMSAAGMPGLVAAARLPGGGKVEVALGARGLDNPAPMTTDTLFWIASCTKAVTCVAAMQLVEEGRVGLDDPVSSWLPQLAEPKRLEGFDDAGQPILAPAKAPITLRRLLSHTSGQAYGFTSAALDRYITATGINANGAEAPNLPLVFEPGEGWIYGVGIDWAGKLVEAVSGEAFDATLRRRVLGPLGMNDTVFFRSDEQAARTASMHARTAEGVLAAIPFSMPSTPYFMMGGGGLYSTASDYLRFLDWGLGEGPPLLTAGSMAELCAPQVEGDEVGVLRSCQPNMSNDFDPFPGARKSWSLGFVSNVEAGPDGRRAGALAWAGLGNCYYWIDRGAGAAGILCAQLLPFGDPGVLAILSAFERAVYAEEGAAASHSGIGSI
jgi:methyl acetate hydrolase